MRRIFKKFLSVYWILIFFSINFLYIENSKSQIRNRTRPQKTSLIRKYLEWDIRLNTLGSITSQNYFDEWSNYLNEILKKPDFMSQLEIQPTFDFKLKTVPLKWVFKPRLKYRYSQYIINSQDQRVSVSEYGFWENYLSLDITPQLTLSAGIINIQWGPSEIINPSQFLIRQQTLLFEPFQYIEGIELVQCLWTPSQNLTFNLLGELKSFHWSHSDELVKTERQETKGLLFRTEYSSTSGAFVIGQVIGQNEISEKRIQYGGYSLWNYTDWTQLYVDYIAQRGSETTYFTEPTSVSKINNQSDEVFYLSVLGHRLTFESGIEWKIEWIHNSFGKEKDERELEVNALIKNSQNIYALTAYYDRSYIFPGKDYLYQSLRFDNLTFLSGLFDSSQFFIRNLFSFLDSSFLVNLEFQSSLSDHWSQALAFVKTFGEKNSELNSELDYYVNVSLKRSF